MTSPEPVNREQSVASLAQMRTKTDLEIPISWLLLPLANYLVWAIVAVALWAAGESGGTGDTGAIIGVLGIVGLVISAAAAYVIFSLVNRVNEHSARSRALLFGTLDSLQTSIRESDVQARLPLSSAEDGLSRLSQRERERSAILWALLSIIPFVGWLFVVITEWRLSRDLAKHTYLEAPVFDDVGRTLKGIGNRGLSVGSAQLQTRNLLGIVIVILSLGEAFTSSILTPSGSLILIYLTIGAISLLWIDLSIRDPVDHFHYHSHVEGDLLRALPTVSSAATGAS